MNERGRWLAIGAVLLVIVGLGVLYVVARGDAPTDAAAAADEDAFDAFVDEIDPKEDVGSRLLAPATADWWRFVTGLGARLNVTDPVPGGATWVGHTLSRPADTALDPDRSIYHTIYVGFETVEQAEAWSPSATCACTEFRRGNVSMLTPAWVNVIDAGLPEFYDEAAPSIVVTEGVWRWDIAMWTELHAQESNHPDGVRSHFSSLGFTDQTQWSARSASPRGPWVGALTGYDGAAVNVTGLGETMADTADPYECDTSGTCVSNGDQGLALASEWEYAQAGDYGWGNPRLMASYFGGLPGNQDAIFEWSPDSSLLWAFDPALLEGALTRYDESGNTALASMLVDVSGDGRSMTVQARFDEDPVLGPTATP